ncbi:MAG TPA: hypothetical protein VFY05_08275 [Candidatus Angelobacter sp.]|nr:hypothetical protein [Candidatus Angelobacter sp.]
MKIFRLVVAGCVLTLAGACFAQQSQPVSLADLVKHSSKPDTKKDVVEFSDANLRRSAPSDDQTDGAAIADSASTTGNSQSGNTDKESKNAKKDAGSTVSGKDDKTAQLKNQLAKYQKEEKAWKDSIKNYQDLIANEPSDFRRQMYQDSLNNDQKNAALFQQKINEVENELNKTQQQSSAPPAEHSDTDASQGGGAQP